MEHCVAVQQKEMREIKQRKCFNAMQCSTAVQEREMREIK